MPPRSRSPSCALTRTTARNSSTGSPSAGASRKNRRPRPRRQRVNGSGNSRPNGPRSTPAIGRLWRNVPFLDWDVEIRRVICSTNAIESLNARYRPSRLPRTAGERIDGAGALPGRSGGRALCSRGWSCGGWGPGCFGGRRVAAVVVFRLELSSGPGYWLRDVRGEQAKNRGCSTSANGTTSQRPA